MAGEKHENEVVRGPDGFEYSAGSPYAAQCAVLDSVVKNKLDRENDTAKPETKRALTIDDLLTLPDNEAVRYVVPLLGRIAHLEDDMGRSLPHMTAVGISMEMQEVLEHLLKRDLPFHPADLEASFGIIREDSVHAWQKLGFSALIRHLKRLAERKQLSAEAETAALGLVERLDSRIQKEVNSHIVHMLFGYKVMILESLGRYNRLRKMRRLVPNFGKGTLVDTAPDTYPHYDEDPWANEQRAYTDFLHEISGKRVPYLGIDIKHVEIAQAIVTSSPAERVRYFRAILVRLAWYTIAPEGNRNVALTLIENLNRRKMEFSDEELAHCINELIDFLPNYWFSHLNFLKKVAGHCKKHGLHPEVEQALLRFRDEKLELTPVMDQEKVSRRLREILQTFGPQTDEEPTLVELAEDDSFGRLVNEQVRSMPREQREWWSSLFILAQESSTGKPSEKRRKEFNTLLGRCDRDDFRTVMKEWLRYLLEKPDELCTYPNGYSFSVFLSQPNTTAVKGLLWAAALEMDADMIGLLARLAEHTNESRPGTGAIALAVGNAAIYALAHCGLMEALSALTALRLRIRNTKTRNLIEGYIDKAAAELGIARGELEDMAVQDFGLRDGRLEQEFGEYTAILSVQGIGKTELLWRNPAGKTLKSAPAEVRRNHAEPLKALRANVKEIQQSLRVQRDRLDRCYVQQRSWTMEHFRERMLEHGLMAFIAKRLIWRFEKGAVAAEGVWQEGRFCDYENRPLEWLDDTCTVSLWHPIDAPVDIVLRWRDFLLEQRMVQPFKQAYREIYVLTDAERRTHTYSNRMAAHILKQHQFVSLAKVRGWRCSLLGAYDDGIFNSAASLALPEHGLQAEFWVNEVNDDEAMNETGIWLYVASDQVRFCRPGMEDAVRLEEIPAILFSEVMRDTDLFVGVASVGNDPAWQDSGGLIAYRDYWQQYSFGNLSETAKIRKQVLERLLPRLAVADRCSIEGRFVHVRGNLRSYKVHIGSTNIQMKPNDEYLCIVPKPDRKRRDKVFLPFEGDTGLSVLISKIVLLAADDTIDDPTILSQIRR